MTLKITQEHDSQRQLLVTVEVPEERVQEAMRKTARRLAGRMAFPGFRRGKVPYRIVEQRLGQQALRAEAAEDMFQSVFQEAMETVEADAYAQPSLDDMDIEPLVLKFRIPLEPEVSLGDYRTLQKEVPAVEVTEEAIDQALERVRERHEILEPVDRPVEAGDSITISGKGVVDNDGEEDVIFNEESTTLVVDADWTFFGQPFVDALLGLSAGDETSFMITFEDDFGDEELAGREAKFNLTVLDVKRRELPALDDDLAQEEGDYETLDELREALRKELTEAAEQQARDQLIEEMITDILADAEVTYPPAAIEAELDDMIGSFKDQVTRSGWQWEDFLRLQGNDEEALRSEWAERASERLRRGLVLRKLVELEKLTVGQAEIEAAAEERMSEMTLDDDESRESMRNLLTGDLGRQMFGNAILMDRVVERITAIRKGEAPDLAALEAAAALDEEE